QTKDYYIAVFELTQKQFALVTGLWPSKFANVSCRDSRPVENVIYNDHLTGIFKTIHSHADTISADSFLGRLRARTGLPFSLPTYAQWQWAAQGAIPPKGEFYIYYVSGQQPSLGDIARCAANSTGEASSTDSDLSAGTAAVGTYVPNDLGLYDMLGNVEEYTGEVLENWDKHTIADEQAWLRATKGDTTLGTKTNPLVDPAGRSDTESVYLRVMGGNYEGDSESITLWRTDGVESGNWMDNKKIGVRLSLTIE
ncbi:MAG: formylglycine-generating enzyme family protein, partial [Kiritimatiellia bacterium]